MAETSDIIVVETDSGIVRWHAWGDPAQNLIGWRAEHEDGRSEYVYLHPSSEIDSGGGDRCADVFLYQGPTGQPWNDGSICYVDVFREEEPSE